MLRGSRMKRTRVSVAARRAGLAAAVAASIGVAVAGTASAATATATATQTSQQAAVVHAHQVEHTTGRLSPNDYPTCIYYLESWGYAITVYVELGCHEASLDGDVPGCQASLEFAGVDSINAYIACRLGLPS